MDQQNECVRSKELDAKAKEILQLASSLPKSYRDKILQDLKHMDTNNQMSSHSGSATTTEDSVRKSKRTSKKTPKLLAYLGATVKLEKPDEYEDQPSDNVQPVKSNATQSNVKQEKSGNNSHLKINNKFKTRLKVGTDHDVLQNNTTNSQRTLNLKRKLVDKPRRSMRSKKCSSMPDTEDAIQQNGDTAVTPDTWTRAILESGGESPNTGYTTEPDAAYEFPASRLKSINDDKRMDLKFDSHIHAEHCTDIIDPKNTSDPSTEQFDATQTELTQPDTRESSSISLKNEHAEEMFDGNQKSDNVTVGDKSDNEYTTIILTPRDLSNSMNLDSIKNYPHRFDADIHVDVHVDENEIAADESESEEMMQTPVKDELIEQADIVPRRRRKPKSSLMASSYTCPECGQVWPTRDSMRAHVIKKHKGNFKCEVCGQRFRYKHAYEKHVSIHNEGEFHKCPHCANMIAGRDRLDSHIQRMHVEASTCKKKYHSCPECDEKFRSVKKLISHQLGVHGKHVLQCGLCSRRFMYKGPFDEHMLEHESNKLIKCEYALCTFHYKTDTAYTTHVARVHEKNAPRPYMCDICSHAFTERRYLKSHMKSHKREKTFVCETCMFETYTVQSLKAHLERKHSMTLAHVCDLCGAKLTSKVGLEHHLRRHYNQRDHVCAECSKSFTSKGQLTAHRKIHEARRFECEVCTKTFVNKFKLAAHLQTHTNIKQFSCLYCTYRCNLKSNLHKHVERVHRLTHPDKFSTYKYVQKVQNFDHDKPIVETLQLVDVAPSKTLAYEGGAIDDDQTLECVPYVEGQHSEVTEQTEAAHALAQMQSGLLVTACETSGLVTACETSGLVTDCETPGLGMAHTPGLVTASETLVTVSDTAGMAELQAEAEGQMILSESSEGGLASTNEIVVVDSVDNVYHVSEHCEGAPEVIQQVTGVDDTMYVLQLQGMNDTLTLSAQDMDTLTGANVIAVEDGSVVMVHTDHTGNNA